MNICIILCCILSSFVLGITDGFSCSTCRVKGTPDAGITPDGLTFPGGCANPKVIKQIESPCLTCGWEIEIPWWKDEPSDIVQYPLSATPSWADKPSIRQKGVIMRKTCHESASQDVGTCYVAWSVMRCYCNTDLCNKGKPPCSTILTANITDTGFLKVFCTEEELGFPNFNSDKSNQCSGVLPTLEQMKMQLGQVYLQLTSTSDD